MKTMIWVLLFCTATQGAAFAQKKNEIVITASFKGLPDQDSLQLFYGTKGFIHFENFEYQATGKKIAERTFRFVVPNPAPIGRIAICRTYFGEKRSEILTWKYNAEAGDEVRIDIDTLNVRSSMGNYQQRFSGKNESKYRLQYEAEVLLNQENYEKGLKDAIAQIEKYQNDLSPSLYQAILIQTYSIGLFQAELMRARLFSQGMSVNSMYDNMPPSIQQIEQLPAAALAASPDYVQYYLTRLRNNNVAGNFDTVTKKEPPVDFPSLLESITKVKGPELQESLVVEFITRYSDRYKSEDQLPRKAMNMVKNPESKTIVGRYIRRLPGEKFLDFSLVDKDGRKVQFSDFAGKTVYIDFWYTGCGWCVKHYKEALKPVEEQFKDDTSVAFLSVCTDPLAKQWLSSVAGNQYADPEGINLYTAGEGQNHPLIKYYNIEGYPCNVLINKDGRIVLFDSKELRFKDNIIELLESLK